jgi:hypothetical protein
MTMDKLKTGSGKRLRTEALTEVAVPVPYDAAAMPGASVLGTDGQIYTSIKIGGVYEWNRSPRSLETGELLLGDINSLRQNIIVDAISGGMFFVPAVQLEGTGQTSPSFSVIDSSSTPSASTVPRYILGRSRGGAGVLQDDDSTGILLFMGGDGINIITGAAIDSRVDGTPSVDNMPMLLNLRTRPDGGSSLITRLRITSSGNFQINNGTGTERLSVEGNIQLTNTANSYRVGTNNVVGSRKTGWAAPTGTATRTAFATSTVTVAQLAERVKALIDDLTSHGLIGA